MFPTALFDSHAHYEDPKFDDVRDALLSSLPSPSEISPLPVCGIINCGCDEASSQNSVALAEKYPFIYAAAGIHPHDAKEPLCAYPAWLCRAIEHEKVVAIGEIGLDYYYDFSPREIQKAVLDMQLRLAAETGMPVIIHDREAHGDCMELIRRYKSVRGVFHAYSGSAEMAKELIRAGWYIAFGGSVTFKNAARLRQSVEAVPLDRMLIETDAPYLAPVPYRGQINDSHRMYATLSVLAEIKGISPEELARITCQNTAAVFPRIHLSV